jgi:hypothetical protein
MNLTCTLKTRILFTTVVTALLLFQIIWDYFHGGIPSHYILHNDELPGLSNSLGLLVLPLVTWFLLSRICKRIHTIEKENKMHSTKKVCARFIIAFFFGIIMSVIFSFKPDFTGYLMLLVFILAPFIRLYWSEYLLGYILGTAFTFGVIIPTVAGFILIVSYTILYKAPRALVAFLNGKIKV